jgi:ABC-2 type transport system permease protein
VRIPFHVSRWALAFLATLLAAAIRFLSGYAIGLLAFWTTRATALVTVEYGVSLFLSGRIAPLSLLPPAVVSAASWLWFPYMLAFPVDLLTGAAGTARDIAAGFGGQLFWTLAWAGLYAVIWRTGIRRYAAVGG